MVSGLGFRAVFLSRVSGGLVSRAALRANQRNGSGQKRIEVVVGAELEILRQRQSGDDLEHGGIEGLAFFNTG